MLYLSDVRDFTSQLLSELVDDNHVYSGVLPDKPDKSIGVYNQKRGSPKKIAVSAPASYRIKLISLLIHWNKSQRDTERAAAAVYNAVENAARTQVNGTNILFTKMSMEEAVDVGTDDNGIFEMVIEFEIYYERKATI